jgi:transcriptional regulator with XRE-family HTH domain
MAEEAPGVIIGRNVRAARRAHLFSQDELAKRAGLSRAGLEKLELGQTDRPQRRTVEKLAGALGVAVEELLSEEPLSPLGQALPSQRPLNGFPEEERRARFERWRVDNERELVFLRGRLAALAELRAEGQLPNLELRAWGELIARSARRIIDSTGDHAAADATRGDELDEVLALLDAGSDVDARLRDEVETIMRQFAEALEMRGKVSDVLDDHPNARWAAKLRAVA